MKNAIQVSRKRAGLLALFVALLLPACRGPLSPEITENDLKYHLGILSSDALEGRMTGTPAMQRTMDYIEKAYRKAGLHPFFPDYRMPFTFRDGMEARGVNRMTIDGQSITTVPLPFAAPGRIESRLVDAGFCLPAHKGVDELAAIENEKGAGFLEGKILICRRHGPDGERGERTYRNLISFQSKYENAKRFKPAALLFLKGKGDELRTEQLREEASSSAPRAAFTSEDDIVLAAAKQNAEAVLEIDFAALERTGYNLGASLRPIAPGQRIIYLGGHYDHLGHGLPGSSMGPMGPIYNGADDNASGTTLILELAAAMKAKLDADPAYLPADVNVVFLNFDAEERGLFGSSRFVESAAFDPKSTIAMINVDMVGRLRQSRGLFIQGMDTADPSLKRIVEEAYAASVHGLYSDEERPEARWMKGGLGPSDHASFYRKKVPVVFLFTGSHGEYHRPEDDYPLINFKGLYALTTLSKQIIRRLAFAPPPVFQQVKEEPKRNDFDFKVRLGIIPGSYDTGMPGLLVGGVVEGAPIGRTGIKDGDIIVEIGTQKIRDIHDLMRFLNDARTGISYPVKWIRNGVTMEARTELMSFDD